MPEIENDDMKIKVSYIIHYLDNFVREHYVQILQCIPAVAIFLLATYRLSDIGQPILFNDEIGYWSNSAFFMGDDWTSVTGRIAYYSYGYSLLLVPIRMLGEWLGWGWDTLYHAAVVMNAGFLVMSYALALKLSERYLHSLNCFVRTVACFTVFTYSSYIVYAHITWTECTLVFFFWVFLYIMMRVVDQPSIGNHIAYAVVAFYLYTVHQRALGIAVTAVLMVLYMRLLRRNRVRDVAAFLGSMYLYSLIHAMVKGNLQNVNYLGGEPGGWDMVLGYALTRRAALIFGVCVLVLFLLWLIDKKGKKVLLFLIAAGAIGVIGYGLLRNAGYLTGAMAFLTGAGGESTNRLSTNELAGQWGVLKNIFSANGLIRLGISMTGKWFYLATATGLVICWGIWGLFRNAFFLLGAHIRQLPVMCGKSDSVEEKKVYEGAVMEAAPEADTYSGIVQPEDPWRDRIWLFGVFLAWFSTFMVSAIYKEGLFKNDDLFNGRYVEFTIGFLILYSLNCLLNDRKWLISLLVCMVLYKAAAYLCQYTLDELQRTEFELAHSVMFGRVIWNYAVPYGRVALLWEYIRPLTVWFFAILMPARKRLSKVAVARTVVVLMIPAAAWSHLGRTIVDAYVVVRNEKQAEPYPQFASWISVLGRGEKIYYILDWANDRNAGALQYMLQARPVTITNVAETAFTEDAFYIVKENLWEDVEAISDNCEIVMRSRGYLLLINKHQGLMERWKPFM